MEDRLLVEKKLREWASQHNFPISQRYWRIDAERDLARELEFDCPETKSQLEEDIVGGDEYLRHVGIPTFERTILTPTGDINYCFNIGNYGEYEEKPLKQDEDSVRKMLKLDLPYTEAMHINIGPRIPNWRLPEITERNGEVYLWFLVGYPEKNIEVAELTEQTLSRESTFRMAISQFNSGGTITLPRYQAMGVDEEVDVYVERKGSGKVQKVRRLDNFFMDLDKLVL